MRVMEQSVQESLDIDERRLMAALSYVGVLVLVPWFLARRDSFVQWHVKQGLVLLGALILSLLAAAWVNVIGGLFFLLVALADIMGVVQALAGRRWRMPGVSWLADKFII
jgi:uncharacterized membrane protein